MFCWYITKQYLRRSAVVCRWIDYEFYYQCLQCKWFWILKAVLSEWNMYNIKSVAQLTFYHMLKLVLWKIFNVWLMMQPSRLARAYCNQAWINFSLNDETMLRRTRWISDRTSGKTFFLKKSRHQEFACSLSNLKLLYLGKYQT